MYWSPTAAQAPEPGGALPSLARAGAAHHGWAAPGKKCKFQLPNLSAAIAAVSIKEPKITHFAITSHYLG